MKYFTTFLLVALVGIEGSRLYVETRSVQERAISTLKDLNSITDAQIGEISAQVELLSTKAASVLNAAAIKALSEKIKQ